MSWTLFLDDIRDPGWELQDCLVARNCAMAENLVEDMGVPHIISFDHDLGKDEPIAMAFMWWLIEGHLDERFDISVINQVIIHSANPVGSLNLKGLWDGFAMNELDSNLRAELRPRT